MKTEYLEAMYVRLFELEASAERPGTTKAERHAWECAIVCVRLSIDEYVRLHS